MRKIVWCIIGLTMAMNAGYAQDVGIQTADHTGHPSSKADWAIRGEYVGITDASMKHHQQPPGGKIGYDSAWAQVNYQHQCAAGDTLGVGVGYLNTHLKWHENPYFRQSYFNDVIIRLFGATSRQEKWIWQADFSVFVNAENFNASYARYIGAVEGRYAYSENLGIHVGFFGATGLKQDELVPIVGLDWRHKRWKIDAIWPVNMQANYEFMERWSIIGALRYLRHRERIDHDEVLANGIYHYRNFGGEVGLCYHYEQIFRATAFVGSTIGGDLKICNSDGRNPVFYKYDSSLYYGLNIDVRF